jgi:hypothetical protein
MATMVTVSADTVQMTRLIEFASDTAQLADQRRDLELRELVNELHLDLLMLRGDEDE